MTTVSNGVVTLEGNVDYWSEHDDAARAVCKLAGVREVRNLVTVEPRAVKVAPETIRQVIDSALERHSTDATSDIQIAIAESTVILTGTVASWPEHDAVLGAVRGTRGIQHVDDQLTIGHAPLSSEHRSP
jgi:osmotically-inducible protein OsmY